MELLGKDRWHQGPAAENELKWNYKFGINISIHSSSCELPSETKREILADTVFELELFQGFDGKRWKTLFSALRTHYALFFSNSWPYNLAAVEKSDLLGESNQPLSSNTFQNQCLLGCALYSSTNKAMLYNERSSDSLQSSSSTMKQMEQNNLQAPFGVRFLGQDRRFQTELTGRDDIRRERSFEVNSIMSDRTTQWQLYPMLIFGF